VKRRTVTRLALGSVGVLALLAAVAYQSGLIINTTVSLPLGVYQTIDAPVERGAYVKFCPPQTAVFEEAARRGYIGAGFCPGGYVPLLKRVLATGGDHVTVTEEGVRINGQLMTLSAPLRADGGGQPMPRYEQDRTLADAELIVMSDVSRVSFDSRYFGPIDRSQVQAVIRPVVTWQ
jgi:conjugative transfer signal peptidase TraF